MEFIRRPKGDEGCVLCGYVGAAPSRGSGVLAHRDGAYVVLNKYPYTVAHLMVVPERHAADPDQLADDAYDALWRLVRDARTCLVRATGCQGMNVGMNLGSAAGAGIAEHLHVHLVPRWVGDNNFMPVIGNVRIMHEYLEATWDHLAPHFAALSGGA
jgi:ATP adenylyltransferase